MIAAAALAAFATMAWGQDSALAVNSYVRLHLDRGNEKPVIGTVTSLSPDSITVWQGAIAESRSVAWTRVERVEVRTGSKSVRQRSVGLTASMTAATALGAAYLAWRMDRPTREVAMFGAIGAGLGFVGSIFTERRHQVDVWKTVSGWPPPVSLAPARGGVGVAFRVTF